MARAMTLQAVPNLGERRRTANPTRPAPPSRVRARTSAIEISRTRNVPTPSTDGSNSTPKIPKFNNVSGRRCKCCHATSSQTGRPSPPTRWACARDWYSRPAALDMAIRRNTRAGNRASTYDQMPSGSLRCRLKIRALITHNTPTAYGAHASRRSGSRATNSNFRKAERSWR